MSAASAICRIVVASNPCLLNNVRAACSMRAILSRLLRSRRPRGGWFARAVRFGCMVRVSDRNVTATRPPSQRGSPGRVIFERWRTVRPLHGPSLNTVEIERVRKSASFSCRGQDLGPYDPRGPAGEGCGSHARRRRIAYGVPYQTHGRLHADPLAPPDPSDFIPMRTVARESIATPHGSAAKDADLKHLRRIHRAEHGAERDAHGDARHGQC